MMPKKLLLGGIAGLVLSGVSVLPAAAQYYDAFNAPSTLSLAEMSDVADRVDNIALETRGGAYAGEVRAVRTDFDGDATRIGVRLRDHNWVWLRPYQVRYDSDRNVLISSLSYGQLEDLSI